MHKGQYKFAKKRNKCDVTIKSTITKIIISGKKLSDRKKKNAPKDKQICRERERERERIVIFHLEKLRRNKGERWK
mgnify:CR=1 FL=1